MTRCGADMARRRKWGVLYGACCLLAVPALAEAEGREERREAPGALVC